MKKINQFQNQIKTGFQSARIRTIQRDFNLDKELQLIEAIADDIFEYKFKFDTLNTPIIKGFIQYFNGDPAIHSKFNLDKGLLITGNIGSGKTDLMKLFAKYSQIQDLTRKFSMSIAEEIVSRFSLEGIKGIQNYMRQVPDSTNNYQFNFKGYCIDDLGMEKETVMYFGDKEDPMSKILYTRYELFKFGIYTHATTNLSTEDLLERYGERIYSRMKEMFNWVVLDGKDRRK
jgi:predicted ATPase